MPSSGAITSGALYLFACLSACFRLNAAGCDPVPPGIVGWWPAEGTANDNIGANNGVLQGGANPNAPGFVGAAFSFDGTNSFVQFPDSPVFHPTNFTLEAWVRFSGLDSAGSGGSPAGEQYIIFKQNAQSSSFEGFDLGKERVGGNDVFRFMVASSAGVEVDVRSTTIVTTGVWYHVAGVRGSNYIQLYFNGQLQSQATVSFPQNYGSFPMYFGASGETYWDHKFKGSLDEPSLYNRPLSSNEIAAIYAAGAAGKCGLPHIVTQPQNQTVALGSNATFSVTASGAAPLVYQWKFDATNLASGTAASLTVTNAQPTNAGNYSVIISSPGGSITSSLASLTVLTPPSITSQPASRTNAMGTTASFISSASGASPLGYQWHFNGLSLANGGRLSGAFTTNLVITNVQFADAGNYTMVATNPVGAAISTVAVLTVPSPPSIIGQPTNLAAVAGSNAVLTVNAGGTAPLSYQWRFGGNDLPGASASFLSLTNVQPANAGNYAVVVTNSVGTITSAVAVLTVLVPPSITLQPANQTNVTGTLANFSSAATGDPPLTYRWWFNGAALSDGGRISGSGSNNLSIANVQTNDAGAYNLIVSNTVAVATSAVATLTVLVPPSITTQPAGVALLVGTNASFTVSASGTPPLNFQWQKDGTNLADGVNVAGTATPTVSLANLRTNDSGAYRAIVANAAGSVTSAVAVLTVTVTSIPPTLVSQPASQSTALGSNVTFTVSAAGTVPLNYQWLKDNTNLADGGALSGASSSALSINGVLSGDEGSYQVVVTNAGGAVTSAVASLAVSRALPIDADALVLVNSTSAKYADFQHFIQPYLDNFGVPYTVQDIATNPPGTNIGRTALIIIGHKQIDTNHLFLDSAGQANLTAAISNGVGLLNFDSDLSLAATPRYQFIQDIFSFAYGATNSGSTVSLPPTQPGSQMHFITSLHTNNDLVQLRTNLAMPGLLLPTNVTALALTGGKPLVAVKNFGAGRAVQWGSYDWTVTTVLGPVSGLDDLVWRGLVWAARKPFAMRGLPNFVTVRIDDSAGPFDWVHAFNYFGFKPFVSVYVSSVSASSAADLRSIVTNGMATVSPHAFSGMNLLYFDYANRANYSDTVVSNNLNTAKQWHINNGIPMCKTIATHYSEIGWNALQGLLNWGIEYLPLEVDVGVAEYSTPYPPWLIGGPYRLYESPGLGLSSNSLYYADFLNVAGHPEFNGKFFNCYNEIRDATTCGQWCPNNSISDSINQGTAMIRRSLDSRVLVSLFSHEFEINNNVSSNNFWLMLQGIATNIAPFQPIYVTADYGYQYVRATRTSRLLRSSFDIASGQLTADWSGMTDLPTQVQVYPGDPSSNLVVTVPIFTNANTSILTNLPAAPSIVSQPRSQTNNAGTAAVLRAGPAGPPPLSYQWLLNGANFLADGPRINGAASWTMTIADLGGADAGLYSLIVSNAYGSVTSSPALLSVIDPVLLGQPQSRTNHAGSAASFSIQANGTAPSFQWLKGAGVLNDATNPTLSFSSVSATDAGPYAVIVSNLYGSVVSATATLSVVGPLQIERVTATTGSLAISWSAIPGNIYSLQRSTNLNQATWLDASPPVTADSFTASATDSTIGSSQGFYRVHLVP